MSTLTIPSVPTANKSAEAITELHNYLLKLAQSDAPYVNPIGAAEPLIAFNGYYALNATGAFLAVDTNLIVKNGEITPHVTLIYSQDGTTSTVYPLTGPDRSFETVTWDRATNTLTAVATLPSSPNFTLTFTREVNQEIIATFQGSISYGASEALLSISGITYNNPIPMAMYAGAYYEGNGQGAEILVIGTDNTLFYNFDNLGLGDGGSIEEVAIFVYNLNMYVFSFSKADGLLDYSVIMGTSATGGMVCNDLFSLKNSQIRIPRSLQTVKTTSNQPVNGTNASSQDLANFAGFYPLTLGTNGFLSIEGQYKTLTDGSLEYTVTLGLSVDGVSSTVYTFDSTMTFTQNASDWLLSIPNAPSQGENLTINFTRQYAAAYPSEGSYYGSVVSISGSYNGTEFTGETALNVVPLMGFAGAPLKVTSTSTETIVITSNFEIEYNGVSYTQLTVVPLMYIVGFIDNVGNEVILSLGTDGGKGVACITTVSTIDPKNPTFPSIEVYTAIPDGTGVPQG
jgi:hypothetical protein